MLKMKVVFFMPAIMPVDLSGVYNYRESKPYGVKPAAEIK